MRNIVLFGYSGHSYSVIDAILLNNSNIEGYVSLSENVINPYGLKYIGSDYDKEAIYSLKNSCAFLVAIGDNNIRAKIQNSFQKEGFFFSKIIHPRAIVSERTSIANGSVILGGAVINPFSKIGRGVIVNTSSVIEHECEVGDFSHIAPGAVLAGNVKVGKNVFIGANAVIKQGVSISDNSIIGAGAVVLKNVPTGSVIVGNPGKIINI